MFDAEYYDRYRSTGRFPWSKEGGRFYGLRSIASILRRFCPRPDVILEVGCGLGFLSKHLAALNNSHIIVSTDISEAALRFAQSRLENVKNICLVRVDAKYLPLGANTTDMVVAYDVIEHLPEPDDFFLEAYRVLKPHGVLLISTPNPASLGCRIKGREWFGFQDDTHISIRSISQWRGTCRRVGFETVRDGTDFWWDSPYFKRVPMLLHKIVFNGTSLLVKVIFGFLPWSYGENYYAVCRKM